MNAPRIFLRGRLAAEFRNFIGAVPSSERAREFLLRVAASQSPDFEKIYSSDTLIVRHRGDTSAEQWPMRGASHG